MNYPLAMQRVMDTSSLCWVRKFNPLFQEAKLEFELVPLFIRPGCASQISSSCGYHSTAMLISNTWTTTAWVRKFITRHHITSKTVSNIWDTKKVRFWSGAGSSAKQQCYDVFQSLQKSRARTGCPVIVNTSFNVRGEPIVCTPEDSYRCFMRTEMDFLVLETCVLAKKISRHS